MNGIRERCEDRADDQREGRDLGGAREIGGDGRGRAFVHIRRPHMERHGRNLEREPGDEKHKSEHESRRNAGTLHHARDDGEIHAAGKAVDQRDTVQHHARRKRAEDEVFESGFSRAQRVAVERREYEQRQRLQLHAHVEADEVGRRNHQRHAAGREHHEDGKFEARLVRILEEALRHQHAGGR